jgi:hypothetical protein
MVNTIKVVRDFLAEKSACERVIFVATQLNRTTLRIDTDYHSACVGTVVRTNRFYRRQFSAHSIPSETAVAL